MSITVPAKLKSADITRFAQRAAQVESFKPALAYWCYYWIVQHILGNGLHTTDDATKAFTTNLMDRLEEMKAKYATEDAIIDDIAGQAYVEQFGLETFQRADNAVRANKATRQTADTFLAAATFLELVNIWATPTPEVVSKIKYAKFHALRIAKAFKSGEDPNQPNPPGIESSGDATALDPNDPEMRRINGIDTKPTAPAAESQRNEAELPTAGPQAHLPRESSSPGSPLQRQQPGVTDYAGVYEHADPYLHASEAPSTSQSSSKDAATAALAPSADDAFPSSRISNSAHLPDLPSQKDSSVLQSLADSGYFPDVLMTDTLPHSQGDDLPASGSQVALITSSSPAALVERTQPHHNFPPPQQPPAPHQAYQHSHQTPTSQQSFSQPSTNAPHIYLTDDMAVLTAQKHAKFAISALNFEDVPTAVKELRQALHSLGAT